MTIFKEVNIMNFTYMIIKPDGIPLLKTICAELHANEIDVIERYRVEHFDNLSVRLYLDCEAVERGNAPIIIGINHIFEQYYGTTAVVLLLNSKKHESKDEFIIRVCALKKELRQKYLGGYRAYEGIVSRDDYRKYGIQYSETLALKRCIFTGNNGEKHYSFQINGIHSPDDIVAYNREMRVLQEYGAFRNPM